MSRPHNLNGGRPVKYKDLATLDLAIEEYFDHCDNRIQQVYSKKSDGVIEIINPEPYTIAGLAYSMGIDRDTLLRYSKQDVFYATIKSARNKVQLDVERRLMEGQATGAIFNLKNNFGYVDKQEIDQNISGELKTGQLDPALAEDFTEFLKHKTRHNG